MQNYLDQYTNNIRKKILQYTFSIHNYIHRGTICNIFYGINQITQQAVAIKVFSSKQLIKKQQKQMIQNTISAKQQFKNCMNVVSCYEAAQTANNIYVIMQFCNEGNLQNMLSKRIKLGENQAIPIFRDIVCGFRSFVQRKYIHRNLRPSNILFKNKIAKIYDFNYIKKQSQDTHNKEQINSPQYTSYQTLTENIYTHKNDIWALGVILFEILHGRLPWTKKQCTREEQIKQIKTTEVKYKIQKNLSEDLKDFIQRCLKINQKDRLNPTQFFQHAFIVRIFGEKKLEL